MAGERVLLKVKKIERAPLFDVNLKLKQLLALEIFILKNL